MPDLEKYRDYFQNTYDIFPDGKLYRLTFDPVTRQFRIMAKTKQLFDELREAFSIENKSMFFSQQYGYKGVERLYNVNKFGYFGPGMISEITKWLRQQYGTLDILALSENCLRYLNDFITPLKDMVKLAGRFDISNISDDTGRNQERLLIMKRLLQEGKNQEADRNMPYLYRDHQKTAIEKLLFDGFGRGLIEVPTAGGKSFIIANFIWNILKNIDRKFKFLILVPNKQLVEQFYSDLLDYGYNRYELSRLTGGMKKAELKQQNVDASKIVIANSQFILKNKQALPRIDAVIVDEVHTAQADKTAEFINGLDCGVKIGCSATLPREQFNLNNLMGLFSKVVFRENIINLQNKGYISNLKITLLDINHRRVGADRNILFNMKSLVRYNPDEITGDVQFNDAYNQELEFYKTNYIELYKPVLEYLNSLNENVLVLFDRIETGKNIFEYSKEINSGRNIYYIDGSTDVKIREEIRQKLENSGDNILFGNAAVMSTGVNIKRLSHLVFLVNTKSFSRTLQSIGRTLRLHSSKKEAHLIDIKYNFKYSDKHYRDRLSYYRENYGKKQPDEIIKLEI